MFNHHIGFLEGFINGITRDIPELGLKADTIEDRERTNCSIVVSFQGDEGREVVSGVERFTMIIGRERKAS